jgi:hypothetical protein
MRSSFPVQELGIDVHRIDAVQLAKNLAEMNKNAPKPNIAIQIAGIPEMRHRYSMLQERVADRTRLAGDAAVNIVATEKHIKEIGKKIRSLEKLTADPAAMGIGLLRKDLARHRASLEAAQENIADWNRAYKIHTAIAEGAQKQVEAFEKDELPLLNQLIALSELGD